MFTYILLFGTNIYLRMILDLLDLAIYIAFEAD